MPAPAIRLARSDDLEGVSALYAELRPADPPWPPGEAQAQLERLCADPDIALVVADCDGVLAATCMLALVPQLASAGRPLGWIEHVVTLPAFRGQGLAQAVLAHALELAWQRRAAKVVLLSGAQRTGAHRVYEAVGFRGDVERGFVAKPSAGR